jgi:transposase
MKPKLYNNEVWLYDRYIKQKKNIKEIAKEADTSYQTIYRYLVKFNLIRNPRKWSKK